MDDIIFYRDENLPFFEIKTCCTKRMSYKKHSHEEYSLGIVEKGSSTFWCDGTHTIVKPESVVFIPSEVLHSCNPDTEQDWKYTMVFVEPVWLESSLELKGDGKETSLYFKKPYFVHEKLSSQFLELVECLTSNASPLEKESQIIYSFASILATTASQKANPYIGTTENIKLELVKNYLNDNYKENVTLDTLSQISGISKYYMIRLFKEKYHVPPHTYQLILRINYAKKELKKQRLTSEVAQDSGFYDQSHFIKQFKFFVGTTPEVYQKSIII